MLTVAMMFPSLQSNIWFSHEFLDEKFLMCKLEYKGCTQSVQLNRVIKDIQSIWNMSSFSHLSLFIVILPRHNIPNYYRFRVCLIYVTSEFAHLLQKCISCTNKQGSKYLHMLIIMKECTIRRNGKAIELPLCKTS